MRNAQTIPRLFVSCREFVSQTWSQHPPCASGLQVVGEKYRQPGAESPGAGLSLSLFYAKARRKSVSGIMVHETKLTNALYLNHVVLHFVNVILEIWRR